MKRLSKADINKLTPEEIKKQIPFELVDKGEVIATFLPAKVQSKLNKSQIQRISKQAKGTA